MQAFTRIVLTCALLALGVTALAQEEIPADERGRPINATFTDADVREVFLKFFGTINASFVLDPRVHGRVTADYKKTFMLDIVDDVARRVNAVTKEKNGIIYIIADETNPPAKENPRAVESFVFRFERRPLRDAVQALFDVAGNGSKSFGVNTDGVVSASGRFDSFAEALSAVADNCGATLSISYSNYYLTRGLSWPSWEQTRVKLTQDHADIRDALRALFRQLNVNYSIAPEVQGTISCDLSGDAGQVLPRLLAAVKSYYRTQSGVVQIVREPRMPSADTVSRGSTIQPPPIVDIPPRFQKVVTSKALEFKARNVREVISTIFTRVPNRFSLPVKVSTLFTGNLGTVSLDKALREICSQAGLDVKFENDVFVFTQRGFVPPGIRIGGGPMPYGWQENEGWLLEILHRHRCRHLVQ